MKNLNISLFVVSTAVSLFGCSHSDHTAKVPEVESFPLIREREDTRPPMQFNIDKTYRLEFGRGSGWHGLDTIKIDDSNQVTLHRLREENGVLHWEHTEVDLTASDKQEIGQLIVDLGIPKMKRSYHADVHDGTQWIFWIVQNGHEKSIYFNNHFPKEIQSFALAIDEKLKDAGIEEVQWRRVPDDQERQHEKAIWKSIKNKPNQPE